MVAQEPGESATESFFLDAPDGVRLMAHFHAPARRGETSLGLVVCAPFGDEQVASHRMLRNLAGQVAARGVGVLRFDPRGLGDSEGDLEEASVEVAREDLSAARAWLGERIRGAGIGLLGVRMGAVLAVEHAATSGAAFLAALAPILHPARAFQHLLRRQALSDAMYGEKGPTAKQRIEELRGGAVVDAGGYPLSRALFDSYAGIDVAERLAGLACPTWIGLPQVEGADAAALRQLRGSLVIAEVDEEPFWEFPPEGSVGHHPAGLARSLLDWLGALSLPAAAGG